MNKQVELVVVIPIGPRCQLQYIEDTIQSILYYTRAGCKIVLADDSQRDTARLVQANRPDVDVYQTPASMGKLGGLYITLSLAFRYVLSRYHFDALLRIDTDALIINKAPEKEAIQLFKTNPLTGLAGQYPNDYNGKPWDISWPRGQVIKYTRTPVFFKRPVAHFALLRQWIKAHKNGYRTGESVFGGACFYSEACLRKLLSAGLLPDNRLKLVNLEEDHLFSLLVKAVGFGLGDLSSGKLPLGCAWKGLPASPQQLQESGKKIIHSTRYWKDMKEEEIRGYFKKKREQALAAEAASANPSTIFK